MTDPIEQFAAEGAFLADAEALADYALARFGDDAGVLLISAAIKVWRQQHGAEEALNLARLSIRTIAEGQVRSVGSN